MQETPARLARYANPGIDDILGKTYPVGSDGFVRVVDYLGGDEAIVQAARISYGAGTKTVSDDETLIRFLLRHVHTTPFEMCELKLHVRVPMDVWRQWIRHRTASVNEYSTRYSEAIDAAASTMSDTWRAQSTANKQGSAGFVETYPEGVEPATLFGPEGPLPATPGEYLSAREAELLRLSREVYEERLKFGVAREQARKDLPLSTYTEAYWKVDLHNLLHFLTLRLHEKAQKEIRDFAEVIATVVQGWVPMTWKAFRDYRLDALTFSGPELRAMARILQLRATNRVVSQDAQLREMCEGMGRRETDEFMDKLHRVGL